MINICIVEDEQERALELKGFIERYGRAHDKQFSVTHLLDGLDLVSDYRAQFDIILLDIQMKHMDGMTAAQRIRAMDSDVALIFITSTVQYAVQGYTVDALGYMLKPVQYPAFENLLEKALSKIESKRQHVYIRVSVEDSQIKVDVDSILYIESQRNNVILHCGKNDYKTIGPLKRFEELLAEHGFSKCHNAYLVKLSAVAAVKNEAVELADGVSLPLSRGRKKEFLADLTEELL